MLKNKTIMFSILLFVCLNIDSTKAKKMHQSKEVMPPSMNINAEIQTEKRKELCERVYIVLQKQAHYLIGKMHPWAEDSSMLLLTDSKSGEHFIRPNTGTIAGLSFLYRFGPYDESIVGLSRENLLNDIIVPMARYLITTHKTGSKPTLDGKQWGDQWQSAHWAHMLGRAGWWIWNDLPVDVREGIRNVVRHEANRFVNKTPPHQIKNDTKAEENAWNSQILSVAILLMPKHENRELWDKEFQKWALSSFLRPADSHSDKIVDGKPVSEQFTGANIHNDFTLENHRIVHPDYMTTFSLSMYCVLDFVMTNRKPPEAIFYNVPGVYENLKWFSLPDGGFVYPNGQDWRLFRNPDWFGSHILMVTFGKDPDAWSLATQSFKTLEKMQARTTSGAIYLDEEFFFPSTQTDILYSLSRAWLALKLGGPINDNFKERTGVLRLDSGKVILNRGEKAIHTFSWGAKNMAQCVVKEKDRIVSPHQSNGIGWIHIKDQNKALPTRIHKVNVQNGKDWFKAKLIVDHGENTIRSFLEYNSKANSDWIMQEKLVALRDITTSEIATGFIGILNNPNWVYEDGKRILKIDKETQTIQSKSGKVIEQDNVFEIQVDNTMHIKSKKPLSIRYGGATQPQRARVTDNLILNYIAQDKVWQKGDMISEYEVHIQCD